ncbi:hypothetical protein PHMEG_0009066 [Phytophthora megakarya]|uniref:HAT C-terminal dimerisation domain-containing protein n=1 Tax=Phytophthora megakarya TaxID=4795 RepID=A0A225WIV4_9STRA|nr:hypothetical protein PHMEG_0009066 [Phytophthora megakarya]
MDNSPTDAMGIAIYLVRTKDPNGFTGTDRADTKKKESHTARLEWWGEQRDIYPTLFRLTRRVFTMPTSSAPTERNWCDHGLIHTNVRNRFALDTVRKLAFQYVNRDVPIDLPATIYDETLFQPRSTNEAEDKETTGICYEKGWSSDDDGDSGDPLDIENSDTLQGFNNLFDHSFEYVNLHR